MRGSVTKKRDRWYVVVELPPDPGTGKRRRKWHGSWRTKKEAEAARARLVTQVADGEYVERDAVTVTEVIDRWLRDLELAGRKPSTIQSYEEMLHRYVVPSLGRVRVQALTTAQLDGLYHWMRTEGRADGTGGLSARSVQYVATIMSKMLKDAAVRKGLLSRNPAEFATKPSAEAPEMDHWAVAEVRQFLAHAEHDHFGALFTLALTTGMRRGEIAGLRWEDVDLDAGYLRVVRARVRGRTGGARVSTPKTKRSRRRIDLDPRTVAVLRRHRAVQAEARLAAGAAWQDTDGHVFTDGEGKAVRPDYLPRRLIRLAKEAGVRPIRFHDLRHTYATIALEAGEHPKVVSERLGHSTVAITLDTYSHVTHALSSEAATRIAGTIFGAYDDAAVDGR